MTPEELERELRKGDLSAGVYSVLGASRDVAAVSKLALESAAASGREVAYFLVSGSRRHRVPCFRRWIDQPTHRLPAASDVVLFDRWSIEAPYQLIGALERQALEPQRRLGLVLVEAITAPSAEESTFVYLLLTSRLKQHAPVLALVHQAEPAQAPTHLDRPESRAALVALHLAGGRLREAEWRAAGFDRSATRALLEAGLVDRRDVGSSTWFSYASASVARSAENESARASGPADPARLARAVKAQPWYPALRVAARTRRLEDLLDAYSVEGVGYALWDDPYGVAAYFHALRRAARAAGADDLARVAAANQVATVVAFRHVSALRLRRAMHADAASGLEPDTLASLWFVAGQSFLQGGDVDRLDAALAAFERGRRVLAQVPEDEHARLASRRAALANGEALVAFKRRDFARARSLERAALDGLAVAGDGPEVAAQRVLIGAHLGDVHLRGFADVEAAVRAYRSGFEAALTCPSQWEMRYVAPRLAAAELARGKPLEAARVLRTLLDRVVRHRPRSEATAEPGLLKAQLVLADAWVRAGQPRSAAARYWTILRSSDHLAPAVARGVADNLRQVHPALKPRHERQLVRLLADHEAGAAQANRVRAALDALAA